MHRITCMLWVSIQIVLINYLNCKNSTQRIAIIGAGIAGCASSYYLIKDKTIEVDLFEMDSIPGGRIYSEMVKDVVVDHGAHFFIKENKLIMELIKDLNIPYQEVFSEEKTIGIWNNRTILLELGDSDFLNLIKIIWRYGFSPIKIKFHLNKLMTKFQKIYEILNNNELFCTLEDFLTRIELDELINQTIESYLISELGVNEQFIDEIVSSLIASIYNQHKEINAFAGIVNLIATNNQAYEITGGNSNLINKLIQFLRQNSRFRLNLNTKINQIILNEDGSYSLNVNKFQSTKSEIFQFYDAVIIACPINKARIEFINFPKNIPSKNKLPEFFQTNQKAYIQGELNPEFFNYPPDYILPRIMLSNNKTLSLTISEIVELKENFYAIQSDRIIYESEISNSNLFKEGFDLVREYQWDYAYPKLIPYNLTDLPSFLLNDNLYYINAMEVASSCMKMELISSRNIANIILRHSNQTYQTNQTNQTNAQNNKTTQETKKEF
jgi:hypothetical protein